MSDTPAYGLWSLVVINSLFFISFAFSFARPRSKRDWRSFDAMTSDRPYRKGLSFEVAKAEILRMARQPVRPRGCPSLPRRGAGLAAHGRDEVQRSGARLSP